MIERFERFSFAISEISRYWHKITATEMEKYGLKGAQPHLTTSCVLRPCGIAASDFAAKNSHTGLFF